MTGLRPPIGDRLWARDRVGDWYESRIDAEDGEGDERLVSVHFLDWPAKFDEWLLATSTRFRLDAPDFDIEDDDEEESEFIFDWGSAEGRVEGNVFEVERLLGKRRRGGELQYLVRWRGWSEQHDSWEPESHIGLAAIDEYISSVQRPRRASEAIPYVLTVCPSSRQALEEAGAHRGRAVVDSGVIGPKKGVCQRAWACA